jgi:HEAT repeat protein
MLARWMAMAFALTACGLGPPAGKEESCSDEALLREAGVITDGAGLIRFLRERSGATPEEVRALIRQLGDDEFAKREQASRRLVALGPVALPELRENLRNADLETALRAKRCVAQLEAASRRGLPLACVRLLSGTRHPGAVESLLRYLPFAADPAVEEEVYYGLDALAVQGGLPHPALATALTDRFAATRAVAACILGRVGGRPQQAAVRKLLADDSPLVRLRASQGLLAAGDGAGLPVLVRLLGEGPLELAWQAEELLRWVAGDRSPEHVLGSGRQPERGRCVAAWQAWWRAGGRRADLTKIYSGPRRPTLLLLCECFFEGGRVKGRVWLCGCDGKPRWHLDTPTEPNDARLLSGGRLLLATSPSLVSTVGLDGKERRDYRPVGTVTERELGGRVLWEYRAAGVVTACLRLPNGNTLVLDGRAAEVTPGGKLRQPLLPEAPAPLRGGVISGVAHVFGTLDEADRLKEGARLRRLVAFDTASGRPVHTVTPDAPVQVPYAVEGLSGQTYLIATYTAGGRLLQVGPTGKTLWDCSVASPNHAVRPRGPNTFAACGGAGRRGRVVEVTPAGETVWEVFTRGCPTRVRPCFGLVRFGFDRPRPRGLDLARSIPYRLSGLQSKDAYTRLRSAEALRDLGALAGEAVPGLIEALDDPDQAVREAAEQALCYVGRAALPALLGATTDRRPRVRAASVGSLWKYVEEGRPVRAAVFRALRDEDVEVRRQAVLVLPRLGSRAKAAVPALIALLEEPRSPAVLRMECVEALGHLGTAAGAALPALQRARKDPSQGVRWEVDKALDKVRGW